MNSTIRGCSVCSSYDPLLMLQCCACLSIICPCHYTSTKDTFCIICDECSEKGITKGCNFKEGDGHENVFYE